MTIPPIPSLSKGIPCGKNPRLQNRKKCPKMSENVRENKFSPPPFSELPSYKVAGNGRKWRKFFLPPLVDLPVHSWLNI